MTVEHWAASRVVMKVEHSAASMVDHLDASMAVHWAASKVEMRAETKAASKAVH